MTSTDHGSRRSGLLLPLAGPGLGLGYFAYVPYKWSEQEFERFAETGSPPCLPHELPGDVEVVAITFNSQDRAISPTTGPTLGNRLFRGLDATALPRLLVWDLAGPDQADESVTTPLAVIPSADIRPTVKHRQHYSTATRSRQPSEWEARMPRVADLISTGLCVADYTTEARGDAAWESGSHSGLYKLLERLAGSDDGPFEFPRDCIRRPAEHRCRLTALHQLLANEDRMRDTATMDLLTQESASHRAAE